MKLKDLQESFYIENLDRAPATFRAAIKQLVARDSDLKIGEAMNPNDVSIVFGEGTLPRTKNTINIGGKFLNKERQYNILKGKVSTIQTYTDAVSMAGKEFIAKMKSGYKQQGQLINELPDVEDDYVFQPLVDILSEYRVIVYFMNNKYHVSGIYKKTGSNISIKSINPNTTVGKKISEMAIKATEELGYSFGGADLAVVSNKNKDVLNINESIGGFLTSMAIRDIGSSRGEERVLMNNYLTVLEVNTMPSMSNPAIFYDLKASMQKNAR